MDMDQGTTAATSAVIGHPAAVDLQQFCDAEDFREFIVSPFTYRGFSWATNGHIIVRVDEDKRHKPLSSKIDPTKVLSGLAGARFEPPPPFVLPEFGTVRVPCMYCDGTGRAHDCEHCKCKCEDCGGSGNVVDEMNVSTEFGGGIFALKYVRQVLSLPGVEIAIGTSDQKGSRPLLFRFTGGVGGVMPRSERSSTHVSIEPSKDPSIT